MIPRPFTAALLACGLLLLGACGDDDDGTGAEAAPTSTAPVDSGTDDADGDRPVGPPTGDDAEPTEPDDGGGDGAVAEPSVSDGDAPSEPTTPPVRPVAVPENLSLKLTKMVDMASPLGLSTRSGSDALYAAGKDGQVVAIEVGAEKGTIMSEVINVADRVRVSDEQGLLGLAFSPDGSLLFLHYSDHGGNTVIDEYTMNGDVADPASRREVLRVAQPGQFHNGGHLAFGPDQFLYIALGDGNSDQWANAQDPSNLLGSILRIDPLGADPYAIPSDNPFVGGGGAPEVFLYGTRNPWKFTFDRATGDLWVADVGLSTFEEIDVLYASTGGGNGANLGWPLVEGSAPFQSSGPPADRYVAPIHEYGRDGGCSISGGAVYRGDAIPELYGSFVFSDFCTAQLSGFASSEEQGPLGEFELGVGFDYGVTAVAEGPDGELYVASFTHEISRIDPA